MLTQERIKELLRYDPSTGELRWKVNRRGTATAGSLAGGVRRCGRRAISIDNKEYFADYVVWVLVYGHPPKGSIKHLNGNRDDNRVENIQDRGRKLRVDNTSGHPCVMWDKPKRRWLVIDFQDGVRRHIGHFHTRQEAILMYTAMTGKHR